VKNKVTYSWYIEVKVSLWMFFHPTKYKEA
jgi:hypothetical protein